MKAIAMLKLIGYNLIRNDDDYIIYKKEINEDLDKLVIFGCQLENVNVFYESETIQIVNIPSIDMELFKAIQSHLKEMGWI